MINICETCGTQFEAIKKTKKYCCRSCQNKAAWIRKKEKIVYFYLTQTQITNIDLHN